MNAPVEHVHTELAWHDGPWKGIADLLGDPHYFEMQFDHEIDDFDHQSYLLWAVSTSTLDLEVEAWHIFVRWNRRYESGSSDAAGHPGLKGNHARYAELEELLSRSRTPAFDARRYEARWVDLGRAERYDDTGPDYGVRWVAK